MVELKTVRERRLQAMFAVSLLLNLVLLAEGSWRDKFPDWLPVFLAALWAIYWVYKYLKEMRYPDNAKGARLAAEEYIKHTYFGSKKWSTKLEDVEVVECGNLKLVHFNNPSPMTMKYRAGKGITEHQRKDVRKLREEIEESEIAKASVMKGQSLEEKEISKLFGDNEGQI